MPRQAAIAGLSGIGLLLAAACGKHPEPPAIAHLERSQPCPDSSGQRDSGVDMGHDVRRGPRYRVDSAGRVETLPPIPTVGRDTTRTDCPSLSDTSNTPRQP